jgi:hypothetical protein
MERLLAREALPLLSFPLSPPFSFQNEITVANSMPIGCFRFSPIGGMELMQKECHQGEGWSRAVPLPTVYLLLFSGGLSPPPLP